MISKLLGRRRWLGALLATVLLAAGALTWWQGSKPAVPPWDQRMAEAEQELATTDIDDDALISNEELLSWFEASTPPDLGQLASTLRTPREALRRRLRRLGLTVAGGVDSIDKLE